MKRVTILHKLPTPYNDELFRVLSTELEKDFRVIHLWKGSEKRPWRTPLAQGYRNTYLSTRLSVDIREMSRAFRDHETFYLFGDWGNAPTLWLIAARILRGLSYGIWADTPQEQVPRPMLKQAIRRRVIRTILGRAIVVVGTGNQAVRTLQDLGAHESALLNLPMMVAVPESNPRRNLEEESSRKPTVFGTAATLYHRKGVDTLIDAFAAVRESSRESRLLIAGDGEDITFLRERAESLGVGSAIDWLGWLEPDQMESEFWQRIHIYVHPARWDPYPLTVLEAMAHGVPVVATNTSGSAVDRLQDGVTAFLVQPDDAFHLSDRMSTLSKDPELQRRFSSKAFEEISRVTYAVGARSLIDHIRNQTSKI